jgi:glycosyltransferase involved in cell wall biosynthesis
MRIAFISHEFPPDTGGGGIGTYLNQVTAGLVAQGHEVVVFAGGAQPAAFVRDDGVQIRRIACAESPDFRQAVAGPFTEVHADRPFDVVEGNDFDASALEVKRRHPSLPYVCKLHTPRFAIDELQHERPSFPHRLRMALGALRRGRRPAVHARSQVRKTDSARAELAALACADALAAPSQAIARSAMGWAPDRAGCLHVFPYPYTPSDALLAIPVGSDTRRITFLGRLEPRKGVLDLAAAIPLVLARNPDARFRFIGRSMPAGANGTTMETVIRGRLGRAVANVEFTGARPPAAIAGLLAETDLLVAPSHWESFGLVCCEGLAAARGVIASEAGGMAEILEQGACGRLVPPRQPTDLAEAICDLLAHPEKRQQLGLAGRRRILQTYAMPVILAAQTACYRAAIERCRTIS